jgi:hypothetical protein
MIHRKDLNQQAIVDALRAIGVSVYVVGRPADLLLGFKSFRTGALHTLLVEIKQAGRMTHKNKMTPAQTRFLRDWNGQYDVIYTVDEALELVKKYC